MSTPEEIRYDGQQQDREDKRREMLERRGRMGGPDAPETCERCGGTGSIYVVNKECVTEQVIEGVCYYIIPADGIDTDREYGPCMGSGVQP
ncbi:hypothetical protein LCGC14_2007670 [marine sediment metagenome]|uniref:Uncharacterized protein n=1 Tax=marine sediment metagenome TaxID=412755 RepID=A0A0F9F172_9ZZZZ